MIDEQGGNDLALYHLQAMDDITYFNITAEKYFDRVNDSATFNIDTIMYSQHSTIEEHLNAFNYKWNALIMARKLIEIL